MTRPDYGIDAPGVVRNLLLAGGACLALAPWLNFLVFPGLSLAASGGAMVFYARVGKFRHRDRILRLARVRAGERVLDVGTGRGLLAVGAARLGASAIGLDVFVAEDLTGNSLEKTRENLALEGVAVDLRVEDAAKMTSLPSASIDCVVSNLCLHNLYDRQKRDAALGEIARVLKPGGRAVISDFRHVPQYAQFFRARGFAVVEGGPYLDTFPWLRIAIAEKPL